MTANNTCAPPRVQDPRLTVDDHVYYIKMIFNDNNSVYLKRQTLLDDEESFVIDELTGKSIAASGYEFPEYFRFSFYGHKVTKMYIASEGFLSFASRLHAHMDRAQYVAPFHANFDLSKSAESRVKLLQRRSSLTIQWEKVRLERDEFPGRNFTFQVTLSDSNDITFVYEHLPDMRRIPKALVFSGIADSFQNDPNTLMEYHRIRVNPERLSNKTVVIFKARETCNQLDNCVSCLNSNLNTFTCNWCPATKQCSSGIDRMRNKWISNKCHLVNVTDISGCGTTVMNETFQYYNVSFEMNARGKWIKHAKYHRRNVDQKTRIEKIHLRFPFPFYGHVHGFAFVHWDLGVISLMEDLNSAGFLYHKRFIAPLYGKYALDEGDPDSGFGFIRDRLRNRIILEWNNVVLNGTKVAFQAILNQSGKIRFIYKTIPSKIRNFPVKVLISDSAEKNIGFLPHLDFFAALQYDYDSYHEIDLTEKAKKLLNNETSVTFYPLENCNDQNSCDSCVEFKAETCLWCPDLGLCARLSGDRFQDQWRSGGCQKSFVSSDEGKCRKPVTKEAEKAPEKQYYSVSMTNIGGTDKVNNFIANDPDIVRIANSEWISLPFDFLFFGIPIRALKVMDKGYLSACTVEHSNLAESQYIAPLMAPFESASIAAKITADEAVFRWENPITLSGYRFALTFQVVLQPNGTITFIYEKLPAVNKIVELLK